MSRLPPADKNGNPADEVLARMPQMIRESLSDEQKEALAAALGDRTWRPHTVDVRVTLPIPYRPFYLTLVGDPERRSRERRAAERQRHPIWTGANILFVVATALVLYGVAVAAVLIYNAITPA